MEPLTKERVCEWINDEIASLEKTIESAQNFGWGGRMAVARVRLDYFQAALKFIEGTDADAPLA